MNILDFFKFNKDDAAKEKEIADTVYLITIYDKLAGQSSSVVQVPNMRLCPRVFKASLRPGDNPSEFDLYCLGTYNISTMKTKAFDKPQIVNLDDLKEEIIKNG